MEMFVTKSKALPVALAAALGLLALRTNAGEPTAYRVGDKVADFALKDAAGKTVRLSDYKGKVVVINFYGFN